MSLTPSGVQASRIRQRPVSDVRRGRERDRLRHHRRRRGKDPGDLQEPLRFLKPLWRLLPVELAKVLHGCGQERIPSGTRARGPLVQHVLLFISLERPEVPGQVVQDRPGEVSVGPPCAYRVRVVAECDLGRLVRVSCRVHRGLVRFSGFQPTVDFAAGQLPASLFSGVRVWGSLENSQAHRRAGMDPESDHVGQVTERSPRETERRLRMETQHDHVSVHRGSPK